MKILAQKTEIGVLEIACTEFATQNQKNGNGKWYIYEFYNDGSIWSGASDDFISNDLQAVIDRINSFKKEKEIVSIVFES